MIAGNERHNVGSRAGRGAPLTCVLVLVVWAGVGTCGKRADGNAAVRCTTAWLKPSDLLRSPELAVPLRGCCVCGAWKSQPRWQQWRPRWQSERQPNIWCSAAPPSLPPHPPPHPPAPWIPSQVLRGALNLMHNQSDHMFCYSLGPEIKRSDLCNGSTLDLGPSDKCHSSGERPPGCSCICTFLHLSQQQTGRIATSRWLQLVPMRLGKVCLLSASPRRHVWVLAGSPSCRPAGSSGWRRRPSPPSLPAGLCTLKGERFFSRHMV